MAVVTRRTLGNQLRRHVREGEPDSALQQWACTVAHTPDLVYDDVVDGESLAQTLVVAWAGGRWQIPPGRSLTDLVSLVDSPTCQHYSAMLELRAWLKA